MIAVNCAECGEAFEIGDEFAGLTEYCPNCGSLNDIPDPESAEAVVAGLSESAPEDPAAPGLLASASFESNPRQGIPAGIWWTILIAGIGVFALSCVYLFSSNWEDRNIQVLSDAANRGDAAMSEEDWAGAAKQYLFVLDTVGQRSIDSAFIQRLMDHSRRGEAEAIKRLHSPQATAAQTQPTAAVTEPAAVEPGMQFHLAISSFQRDYEAFTTFVHDHPVVFLNGKGNWRRRQFYVWQLAYDPPADSDSPAILLRFDCALRITAAHADRAVAERDDNFAFDESPKIVDCQTRFEFLLGRWLIEHQDANPESDVTPAVDVRTSLGDLYTLEGLAFHVPGTSVPVMGP